ncbi:MAG: hypothetical protein NUV65_04585 [Candidatus Roizmanbacteria bacterium]|nr:hypothetical protein [Candidatus Roizmanbacteria bacterium]
MKEKQTKPSLLLKIFFLILLFVVISYSIKTGVIFDIDVARDFLLMNDIVKNHHLTLIGARTAINGVYHGPFWLYLNLPVFIFSHGNPAYSTFFWLLLFLIFLGSLWYVGKKLFDEKTGLLSMFILTSHILFFINSPTNPFVAVILFPIYFYLLLAYIWTTRLIYLVGIMGIGGILIQSEMVFGVPIMLASLLLVCRVIFKTKKINHLFTFPLLLLAISTFIMFDVRHNGLQIQTLIHTLSENQKNANNFSSVLNNLYTMLQGNRLFIATPQDMFFIISKIMNIFSFIVIIILYILARKEKNKKTLNIISTFLFLYSVFWVALILSGNAIHWYYYWAFSGVSAILIAQIANRSSVLYTIVFIGIIFNLISGINYVQSNGIQLSRWAVQKKYAESIYQDSAKQFGYFINTDDQISNYIPMYTMLYEQQLHLDKNSSAFIKKKYTYIIIGPYPDRTLMDNRWWTKNILHIEHVPIQRKVYPGGYAVELFKLSELERKIPVESVFSSLQYR